MDAEFVPGQVVYIATELKPYYDAVPLGATMRAMRGQGPFTIRKFVTHTPPPYLLEEKQPGGDWMWDQRWLVPGTHIKDIDPNEIEGILIKGE